MSSIPVSEVSHMQLSFAIALSYLHYIITQFYCEEHRGIGESFGRFAFCKDLDTLRQAGERLQALKKYLVL